MSTKHLKIAHYIFRWGGIATMVFSVYLFSSNAIFWVRAEATTGTVVGQEQMEGIRQPSNKMRRYQEKAYAPYITFSTEAGKKHTFLSNIGYGKHFAFRKGDKVPVLYLPSSPQTAKVKSLLDLFVLPLVLFGFGGVFWLVGIFMQFMAEPSKKDTGGQKSPQ